VEIWDQGKPMPDPDSGVMYVPGLRRSQCAQAAEPRVITSGVIAGLAVVGGLAVWAITRETTRRAKPAGTGAMPAHVTKSEPPRQLQLDLR
jgi:hypothetical protein